MQELFKQCFTVYILTTDNQLVFCSVLFITKADRKLPLTSIKVTRFNKDNGFSGETSPFYQFKLQISLSP